MVSSRLNNVNFKRSLCLVIISLFQLTPIFAGSIYQNIIDFGAKGDGISNDTKSIQNTIDHTAKKGGGVVYFPPGTYLITTIFLRDNISLKIDTGTKIISDTISQNFDPNLGSFEDSAGKKLGPALFFAKDVSNISISGNGIIDGRGYTRYFPRDKGATRPSIFRFFRCKNVKIEDLHLRNSAAWVQHYIECEDLLISGLTVRSYSNKNNDGLNIDGCRRVIISKCNIDSEDDSIVLKSLTTSQCKDIVISDCIISGLKSAIKTGTESLGGFENITVANCTIYGTRGISLLTVDGGSLNNVTISNISMRDSYGVIVMRLGDRMRGYAVPVHKRPTKPGSINNVMITNIQAIRVTESNDFICGIPDYPIQGVTLDNIRIHYLGGGIKENSFRKIPELSDAYPKAKMFGVLPAYGFYIRHVNDIKIYNLDISYEKSEFRSALYCDDITGLQIRGLRAESSVGSAPLFWLKNTQNVQIKDCQPINDTNIYMKIEGEGSKNIQLTGISGIKSSQLIETTPEVSSAQIKISEAD